MCLRPTALLNLLAFGSDHTLLLSGSLPLKPRLLENLEVLKERVGWVGTAEVGTEETGMEQAGKEEAGKEEAGKEEAGKEDVGKEVAGREDTDKEEAGLFVAGWITGMAEP
jgi:hypothetical protein